MKKILISTFIFLTMTCFAFSANKTQKPSFEISAGLYSGHVFYGENEIQLNDISYPIKFDDGIEIFTGASACVTLNFTDRFGVYSDLAASGDFNWNSESFSHHIDYAASAGVKFGLFSSIPGLYATVGYLLGSKTDFIRISEDSETLKRQNPFGNGYKFGLEYNFSRMLDSKFLPTIGCYWQHTPRGNYHSDNTICAFAQVNLF